MITFATPSPKKKRDEFTTSIQFLSCGLCIVISSNKNKEHGITIVTVELINYTERIQSRKGKVFNYVLLH